MTFSRYVTPLLLTAMLAGCGSGNPTLVPTNPVNVSPSPSPTMTATASPSPLPTATGAPTVSSSSEITLSASITGIASGAVIKVTDASTLVGFGGAHTFGRGDRTTNVGGSNPSVPIQVTDCKLTVGATDITLQGGGLTFTRPLVGVAPNMTEIRGLTAPGPIAIQNVAFTDGNGYGIGFQTFAGKVATIKATSYTISGSTVTITQLVCGLIDATSAFTDRSLDTFTIPNSALTSLSSRAGSQTVARFSPAVVSDLGGASGSANLGLGSFNDQLITDCTASVANGVLSVSSKGGTLSVTSTLGSSASDSVMVVTVPGQPTRYQFVAANVTIEVNQFGNIISASGSPTTGGTYICPGGGQN